MNVVFSMQEAGSLEAFALGYNYFGFHSSTTGSGMVFREWCPQVLELSLVGDFNRW